MARIPGEEQFSGLPSARSGRPIASPDLSPAFAGSEVLAATLTQSGQRLMNRVAEERQKVDAYTTETRFQEWRFAESQRYEESVRGMEPGQASGFASTYSEGYQERAREFLSTVPEGLRPDYDGRLFDVERQIFSTSLTFEQAEQRRFAVNALEDTLDDSILPRLSGAASPDDVIAEGNRLIDANFALTPSERDEAKRIWQERAERAFVEGLPAEERGNWLGTNPASNADRIIEIESGGDPNARNPNSSATGLGQFTEGTWLGMVTRYRPDLAAGMESDDPAVRAEARARILELRTDPALSREMTGRYAEENASYLESRGFSPTPGNVYLAHFLGPAGAAALLGADPNRPVEQVLSAETVEANGSILAGKTVLEVVAWAEQRMGSATGTAPPLLTSIPYEDRRAYSLDADAEMVQADNARRAEQEALYEYQRNDLMVGILDGTRGLADIQQARRDGWLTEYEDINRAMTAVDDRNGEMIATAQAITNLQDPGYTFNGFSDEDRDSVDLAFDAMGGTEHLLDPPSGEWDMTGAADRWDQSMALARLRYFTERTDIVPTAAVEALRGGMYSRDAATRDAAMAIVDGLYRSSPLAVTRRGFTEADIDRLQTYQALSPNLPPEELAAAMDPTLNGAELERRNTLRSEGRSLAGDIATETILASFDPGIFQGQPQAPIESGQVLALRNDFTEVYAERYAATGNADVAYRQTVERIGQKWAITDVGSDRRLMAYAPENYLPQIDGSHRWLDENLTAFVEEQFGSDVVDFGLVPAPQTEAAVDAGRAPVYLAWAIDRDGTVHSAGFEFDFDDYRQANMDSFFQQRSEPFSRDRPEVEALPPVEIRGGEQERPEPVVEPPALIRGEQVHAVPGVL